MTAKPPFEQVVTRHGPTILRVCRAALGPVDADDAWSETFLSALRAYPDLPPGANLEAWLVTIAHRRAIDVIRARARRAVPQHDLPDHHDVRTVLGPRPAGVPGADDDAAELYAALSELPDKQRLAVAYHHLGGLPHAEVAVLLGSNPAAARRASADGIAALRRRLDPQPGPAVAATGGRSPARTGHRHPRSSGPGQDVGPPVSQHTSPAHPAPQHCPTGDQS